MNLLKPHVLVLNNGWLPIGVTTFKKALVCLCSEGNGSLVAKALDICYKEISDGVWDFDSPTAINAVPFEEWVNLPVRPFDLAVNTPNKQIRLPSIIVTLQFSKMPMRKVRATSKNIMERDNYTCQYTGVKLPKSKLSLDHIHPRALGGKETFTNLVTCSKEINSKKGHKTNEEAGLKLIRRPSEPLPMPASALIKEIRSRDWAIFINKR